MCICIEHTGHINTIDICLKLISFTLNSAQSRVGRGNLVLRHSVSSFRPPMSGGILCGIAEFNAAPRPKSERTNENINLT